MDILKTRDVITPIRANDTDAGIDFFVPNDLHIEEMIKLNPELIRKNYELDMDGHTVKTIILEPHERILIPSGIYVKLPKKHALIANNKSGVATKTGLVVGACVVDEKFQGEILMSLINTSKKKCVIHKSAKIIQFVLTPVNYAKVVLKNKPLSEFFDSDSNRGDGGFGSTNKA